MDEKDVINKQLLKNMIATFITFTIIFASFSITIYHQVQNTMYINVDRELYVSAEKRVKENNMIQRDNFNPRVIMITRNASGEIINTNSFNQEYIDYLNEISFSEENINKIITVTINGEYSYRMLTIKQNDKYIQVLATVEAEEDILQNFGTILGCCTAIAIMISIIASYFLSKRTIKPIAESWKKQTEFVQNASHELRTPLTIVQAKQELLLQKPESKVIDNLEDIRISLNETKRLTKLIKDLMVLARADSKKYQLDKEEIEIDNLIADICIPYKEFAELDNKKIELDLKYGKKINIDVSKMNQLMIILLDNAIKYTESADTIGIYTFEKDGKCIIEVRDTGIGIDDDSIKHVFDRFYRADKARSRETGGTGLGLAIANWIVNVHDGTIKAIKNNPKGTIFRIELKK